MRFLAASAFGFLRVFLLSFFLSAFLLSSFVPQTVFAASQKEQLSHKKKSSVKKSSKKKKVVKKSSKKSSAKSSSRPVKQAHVKLIPATLSGPVAGAAAAGTAALSALSASGASASAAPSRASAVPLTSSSAASLTAAAGFNPLELDARAYFVANPDTDTVILEKNADMLIPPASLTKVMTAYLVFEALEKKQITLDTETTISKTAWKTGGSKMFVEVGKKVKVNDLLSGMLAVSGNDAAWALAELLGGGSEEAFVQKMNAKAKELGMTHTHFGNCNGLPNSEQISTARDLYTLAKRTIHDFPQYYHYFSIQWFTYSNITQPNRNHLIRNPETGVDGMKTGFVDAGGYHLMASSKRNNARVISIVLGASKPYMREKETLTGLNYAYKTYKMFDLIEHHGLVEDAVPVWLGQEPFVPLVAGRDLSFFLMPANRKGLEAEVFYKQPLIAPIEAGQQVGVIRVKNPLNGKLYEIPLVAGKASPQVGFFKRNYEKVKYMLTGGEHLLPEDPCAAKPGHKKPKNCPKEG